MKLKPEELSLPDYKLLDSMDHNNLVPFVKKFIHKRTWYSAIYYLSIAVSFAVLLFILMKYRITFHIPVTKVTAYFLLGILIAFILIPLHELIHAIAYKIQGATTTSYTVHLKKFYFLAIADKFVANKKEFQVVALAPFVTITTILISLLFFSGKPVTITILATIMTHAMACSGDFALLSFYEFHKDKKIVTYDDKENKISYFYEQILYK